jgi:hypothetical protein
MKVQYNEKNNTLMIVDITDKEAMLISAALNKSPIVKAVIGERFIEEFDRLKDKAQKANQG